MHISNDRLKKLISLFYSISPLRCPSSLRSSVSSGHIETHECQKTDNRLRRTRTLDPRRRDFVAPADCVKMDHCVIVSLLSSHPCGTLRSPLPVRASARVQNSVSPKSSKNFVFRSLSETLILFSMCYKKNHQNSDFLDLIENRKKRCFFGPESKPSTKTLFLTPNWKTSKKCCFWVDF